MFVESPTSAQNKGYDAGCAAVFRGVQKQKVGSATGRDPELIKDGLAQQQRGGGGGNQESYYAERGEGAPQYITEGIK